MTNTKPLSLDDRVALWNAAVAREIADAKGDCIGMFYALEHEVVDNDFINDLIADRSRLQKELERYRAAMKVAMDGCDDYRSLGLNQGELRITEDGLRNMRFGALKEIDAILNPKEAKS